MQALFDSGKRVYSFSKLSTIENCKYGAFLQYVDHRRGDDSIYGILGGCVHDKLEDIMNGRADAEDLKVALTEDLLQMDMLGLEFPKDFKGGNMIRDNWVNDMQHFVDHFEPPQGDFKTEELLIYKVDDDHYLQGYADLVRYDSEDKSVQSILDWKTSSMYDKAGFLEHGRQLVIYALAKEQQGIEINELAWIFLKYVTVTFQGRKRANSKNRTEIVKHINRGKIIKELDKYIRDDLALVGYSGVDIDLIMYNAIENNSFDVLPEEVKVLYKFEPCVITYELTDEIRQECIEYIQRVIKEFESIDTHNPELWGPREFYKTNKLGKQQEDTFFCNFLCNFRKSCEHLKEFHKQSEIDIEELLG